VATDRQQVSNYDEVWASLRGRVCRKMPWQRDRIWLVDDPPEPDKLPTGAVILVRFNGEKPVNPFPEPVGGGRLARVVNGTVTLAVWTRNARDQAGRAESLLLDKSAGLYTLAERLMDVLDQKTLRADDKKDGRELIAGVLHWEGDGDSAHRDRDWTHGGVPVYFTYTRLRNIDPDQDVYD
jgi:hypothetical protein